jgi:hypothetical protein
MASDFGRVIYLTSPDLTLSDFKFRDHSPRRSSPAGDFSIAAASTIGAAGVLVRAFSATSLFELLPKLQVLLYTNFGRSPWMVEHLTCTIGCRVAAIDEWLLTS